MVVIMQWRFLNDNSPKTAEDLEQILLQNRQITDPESFFKPITPDKISLEDVGLDVDQVRIAKERVLQAIEKKEQILVFGDYDADGVCATAILWEALYSLGAYSAPRKTRLWFDLGGYRGVKKTIFTQISGDR
jgi:single-stranded-DNA-specific exonuclease